MKQMFDMSEKLIAEQSDEIYGVNTINWGDSSWIHLSLIGDEEVIILSHAKFYVFSDSVLCLGKVHQNPQSNIVWEDKLTWFKSSLMEFEWNISCRCSTTSHWDLHKISKNGNQALNPFRWSFLGPGSEKKWYSTLECKPQGEWDRVAELMVLNSVKADTPSSDPRVHCPEECSKAKVVEKYQHTFALMRERLKLFFAQLFLLISSVCTEQSQICVKNTKPAM